MLFGEHAVIYGQPCIVAAVDERITLSASLIPERKLRIEAPDVGLIGYEKDLDTLGMFGEGPKGARFVESAVKTFYEQFGLSRGVEIKTHSEFKTSGLGSSSAATVCTIKALSELLGRNLSERELFDLSYKTVLGVQKTGSGFDVAAVIWGGTLYFLYGGEKIEPIKSKTLDLVIGHCGIKAETPVMVAKVAEKYQSNKRLFEKIFELMGQITDKARECLEKGEFLGVGELADLNQGLLDAIGVNIDQLSRLIFAARQAGAYGAKLSGAGGGDCMFAIVDLQEKSKVEEAITQTGGRVIHVNPGAEGVRVEK